MRFKKLLTRFEADKPKIDNDDAKNANAILDGKMTGSIKLVIKGKIFKIFIIIRVNKEQNAKKITTNQELKKKNKLKTLN